MNGEYEYLVAHNHDIVQRNFDHLLTVATGHSTTVIEAQFSDHSKKPVVIVCDRYSAYKKFARERADFVILAYGQQPRRTSPAHARSRSPQLLWFRLYLECRICGDHDGVD